ncbi:MAG: hypothetical protein WC464_04345 [Bdellovibrionales bacterium]
MSHKGNENRTVFEDTRTDDEKARYAEASLKIDPVEAAYSFVEIKNPSSIPGYENLKNRIREACENKGLYAGMLGSDSEGVDRSHVRGVRRSFTRSHVPNN